MSPLSISRLAPGDYRVMPWKNGGGSTTELLIEPPGAALDSPFLWRLSMARVASSGPFSPFPGYDRTLLLLDGGGMALDHHEHGTARLERPLEPVRFQGEWDTTGALLAGPCQDFNVMSRRGKVRHELEVLRLGETVASVPAGMTVLLFDVRGTIEIELPAGSRECLEAMELMRVEGAANPAEIRLKACGGEVVAILVRIQSA